MSSEITKLGLAAFTRVVQTFTAKTETIPPEVTLSLISRIESRNIGLDPAITVDGVGVYSKIN